MFSSTSSAMPRSRRLRTSIGLAAVSVAAASLAFSTPAMAAVSSTTVTPAGDSFQASLASGSADFTVGSTTVSCSNSGTSGAVPAAPDNNNPAGPVSSVLSTPTFTSCSTNVFLVGATSTANSTNGNWGVALQYDPAGSTGTMTIPAGGVVVQTSGLANCTITVSPSAAVTVQGTWVPGTATAAPQLQFSKVSVPVVVTGGFGCPTSATSSTFTANYSITDTTNSAAQIAVAS